MSLQSSEAPEFQLRSTKRPRTSDQQLVSSAGETLTRRIVTPRRPLLLTGPDAVMHDAEEQPIELLPRMFERMALTIDPKFADGLTNQKTIGYFRPHNQRMPTVRYYELNVTNFRESISKILTTYLKFVLAQRKTMSLARIDAEVTLVVPLITNACMAALYSKLRTIHSAYQTYITRFTNRPTYTKEIELPLPLADAIDNVGIFTLSNTEVYYICVPLFPEGTLNEGRSVQAWNSFQYEAYIPMLKEYGIPVKSIDTRRKNGTPWWTYKVSYVSGSYDFRCIYPPANYTEHSAMLASMFARLNEDEEILPIITHQATDVDYPYRFREMPEDYQVKAFAALCQASSPEWNLYLPVTK